MKSSEIFKRIAWSLLIGLVFGAVTSELAYYFLKTGETRPPTTIELDIPAGTAARIASGDTSSSIPTDMLFVVGDVLLVKNEDSVPHELGPLFIPPNSSATMNLGQAQNYTFACSFQPSKYIGLNVQLPLDLSTRLFGILEAGVPMGVLIALYAIVSAYPKQRVAA